MDLDNNPAGSPPTADTAEPGLESEILEVLGFNSDTSSEADKIASGEATTPPSPSEPSASAAKPGSEAAGVEPAPTPAVTPPATNEPPQQPAAPAPTEGQPQGAQAPSLAPSATQPAAPQPEPQDAALKMASLEATVNALQEELARARANPQTTATPTGQPATAAPSSGQPDGEAVPYRYALTLPQAVQEALVGDDPAKTVAAINSIVNDLGTIVHNTVLTQVRAEMRGGFESLANMATEAQTGSARQSAVEASKQAYFSKFPTHNRPEIEVLVRAENAKLAAAYPNAPFDDNYMNALGARVNGVLASIGAAPAETETPPAPVNTPAARPAAMLPSGNRSAPVTPSGSLSDEIMDTLDPFSGG